MVNYLPKEDVAYLPQGGGRDERKNANLHPPGFEPTQKERLRGRITTPLTLSQNGYGACVYVTKCPNPTITFGAEAQLSNLFRHVPKIISPRGC